MGGVFQPPEVAVPRHLHQQRRNRRNRQVTDALADSVWPAWDAGGKYLWFLASTDFGLKSQWLDMTSYDHNENFGLYFAVLKKGDPSPLLPESDEDQRRGQRARRRRGGGRGGRGGRGGGSRRRQRSRRTPRRRLRRARRSTCRSISTACSSASSPCPGCRSASIRNSAPAWPERSTILEAAEGPAADAAAPMALRRRQHAAALSPERPPRGAVRHRRRGLRRQRRRPQAGLSRRRRRRRTWRTRRCRRRRARGARRSSSWMPTARRPQAGAGAAEHFPAHVPGAQGGVQADLLRRLAQPARLPLRAQHARRRLAEDEGDVRPVAALRQPSRRPELPARHDGLGDRHRPLLRARRRHARAARLARRPAGRGFRDRQRPLQDRPHLRQRKLESRSARAPGRARRGRVGGRLHPGDQWRGTARARQYLSPAGRHRQPSDGPDGQQPPVAWKARGR